MKLTKSTIGTFLSAGTIAIVTVTGAGVAHADPPSGQFRPLAGVGSETTTPVMNFLAESSALSEPQTAAGTKLVGSYNATTTGGLPATIKTKADGCEFGRPNGSGAGRTAFLNSLQTGSATAGCIQFSRSSSANTTGTGKLTTAPNLVFVPFALENVSYALKDTSGVNKYLNKAQLQSVYNSTTCTNIKPMIPQAGSGTTSYWLTEMYGSSSATPPACVQNGFDENSVLIEEHNASQVGANEIVPMSVAQFSSQVAGIITPDTRQGVRLGAPPAGSLTGLANAVNPFADNATFQRPLFNLITEAAATGSNDNEGATVRKVFQGQNSLMCSAQGDAIVLRFGLRLHPQCGDTTDVTL